MTTDLASVQQIPSPLELSGRDHEAAQAVADGIRDARSRTPAGPNASAWRRFQAWAETGGHLAATGRSMATIEQARAALSHFRAVAGMQKADNPARHPVVAEAVRGWRNRAPSPRQSDALTSDALARVREVLRLPRRGRGRRMESPETAHKRAALDPAIIGVLADGGFRRPEAAARTWSDVELWAGGTGHLTVQKGKY